MATVFTPRGMMRVGADLTAPVEENVSLSQALKQITPALIVVGVVGGAAFALGSGIVQRWIFPPRRR